VALYSLKVWKGFISCAEIISVCLYVHFESADKKWVKEGDNVFFWCVNIFAYSVQNKNPLKFCQIPWIRINFSLNSKESDRIKNQFHYFWGCQIRIRYIFFQVCPLSGLKLGLWKAGVKLKVFNRNNSFINFSIFGGAESKSAINFHIGPMWGPKSKEGIKFKVFDRNNL